MDQSNTAHPPALNVDPTAVDTWPNVQDESVVSAAELVLLRRTEFLATQIRSIMQMQERILRALDNVSSTDTGVTETTDGDDLTGLAGEADPTVIAAFEALNNQTGDMNIALTEAHQAFMDDTGNKLYVKRTIHATKAAMSFRDHIGETFAVESSDDAATDSDQDLKRSIVDHLAILNSDLVTAIYINLNKAMKARKSKAKGKKGGAAATRASTPAEATQDILSSPLAHRVRRSTGRIFVSSDSEEPAGASTPKANPGHSDENSQQTQVSLTSVEVRRSNQTLRFESESEGDDEEMRG